MELTDVGFSQSASSSLNCYRLLLDLTHAVSCATLLSDRTPHASRENGAPRGHLLSGFFSVAQSPSINLAPVSGQ